MRFIIRNSENKSDLALERGPFTECNATFLRKEKKDATCLPPQIDSLLLLSTSFKIPGSSESNLYFTIFLYQNSTFYSKTRYSLCYQDPIFVPSLIEIRPCSVTSL